ncbi:MAG: DUF2259 domain-containing protein [Phyllobacterium sp.]
MPFRRLASAAFGAALAALAPSSSWAGDVARLDILGFSSDGNVFAFEEYGIQDGSGFPYANRFYIDTRSDRFVTGTPVRVRIDDESATLETARGKARKEAEAMTSLPDETLRANAGDLVASNPVTELSADPFAVRVNPRPVFPAMDPALQIRLEEIAVPAAGTCQNISDVKGMRLTLLEDKPDAGPQIMHEDKTVPASRGCPLGYGIGAVQTLFRPDGKNVLAVMIAVRGTGFEGPDYRWLAVTAQR